MNATTVTNLDDWARAQWAEARWAPVQGCPPRHGPPRRGAPGAGGGLRCWGAEREWILFPPRPLPAAATARQDLAWYAWRWLVDIRQPHYPHTQEHRCVA